MENDPLVLRLAAKAGVWPEQHPANTVTAKLERIYKTVSDSVEACYLFERGLLPDCNGEQLIRFPTQMQWDMGGCCIDFVLLLAAVCRAARLMPIVVVLGGEGGVRHALLGVWTRPAGRLTIVPARMLADELRSERCIAVEATAIPRHRSFTDAAQEGRARALAGPILWGVDVEAGRSAPQPVAPLPEAARTFLTGLPERITDVFATTRRTEAASLLSSFRLAAGDDHHALDRGRTWPLRGNAARIGRHAMNHVRLRHHTVSREHASLLSRVIYS
jgi:hypothetical protein